MKWGMGERGDLCPSLHRPKKFSATAGPKVGCSSMFTVGVGCRVLNRRERGIRPKL